MKTLSPTAVLPSAPPTQTVQPTPANVVIPLAMLGLLSLLFDSPAGGFGQVTYAADQTEYLSAAAKANGIKVVKTSVFAVRIGCDYERIIRAHLVKAGKNPDDFTLCPMKGGSWVKGHENRLLVSTKGNVQCRVIMRNDWEPAVSYTLNGKPAEYGDVEPYYTPSNRNPAKQASMAKQADRQGVSEDEAVIPRNLTLANILRIAANGQVWEKQD